jgi:hypothetical protein
LDTLHTLATLLPLSLTSGFNLYATVLVVGLSIRFHWVTDTPANLEVLSSWPVLICAAVLYIIQFVADKIQIVDNIWDIIHTFIRPVGAAMIGLATLGKVDPVLGVLGALVAGGIALASHGGKASARVALNVASPAENITNIALSIAEDVATGGLAFLALKYPYIASGIAILLLGLILFFTPVLLRWLFFFLRAIVARFSSLGQRGVQSDPLPPAHMAFLNHQPPELAVRCKAQGIKGANGRNGFVVLRRDNLMFTYDSWGRSRSWSVSRARIPAAYLQRQALMDVLEVHYYDEKNRDRPVRFVFLKDRSASATQLQEILHPKPQENPR